MHYNKQQWVEWIEDNVELLSKGYKLDANNLPHPIVSGFKSLEIAEDHEQIADYTISLPNKERLHVWEFKDGSLVAHIDKYDPDVGPINAAMHIATETRIGKDITSLAFGFLIGYGLVKLKEHFDHKGYIS